VSQGRGPCSPRGQRDASPFLSLPLPPPWCSGATTGQKDGLSHSGTKTSKMWARDPKSMLLFVGWSAQVLALVMGNEHPPHKCACEVTDTGRSSRSISNFKHFKYLSSLWVSRSHELIRT
jgi:hypothetical protein